LNADTSVVMPLRRKDQATLITITSPTPGQKPIGNKFGINLMPQTASSDDGASVNPAPAAPAASRMPVVEEDYTLEEFLAELRPKDNWMDDL
ncbi:DUF2875 domain-containing protein, partial [Pseudomonas sp. LPH60]|nr:DUF2875 domain-containing protein [Pseudomonas sp. LPH60]